MKKSMSRQVGALTLQMMNLMNREFWSKQMQLRDQRMSNDAFLQIAIRDISSEAERGISLTCRKTFEVALADAENAGRIIHAELSRKGGKAFRSDALQCLIRQFVSQNSGISHTQLLDMLRGEVGAGVIDSIDEESSLLEGDIL